MLRSYPSPSAAGDRVGTEARKQAIALSTFFKTSGFLQTLLSAPKQWDALPNLPLRLRFHVRHVFVLCYDGSFYERVLRMFGSKARGRDSASARSRR